MPKNYPEYKKFLDEEVTLLNKGDLNQLTHIMIKITIQLYSIIIMLNNATNFTDGSILNSMRLNQQSL